MPTIRYCQDRFYGTAKCQSLAIFVVSVGDRKFDAQDTCRRHLARTCDALLGAENRNATLHVREIIQ
jgi:hypothetical protein